jgi:hypothetical protein
MTPTPVQQQPNDSTHQSSHRDTQQSNASTDSSNFHQRPTFKARSTHLCITIRWPAKAGQTRHAELILTGGPAGDVDARLGVGSC